MAKAKAKVDTKKNGKYGEVIEVAKIVEMEEYLTSAKDVLEIHDEQLEEVKASLKELHTKVDRALSRLGIS